MLEHEIVVNALEKGLKREAAIAMHEHLDHVLPVVEVAKMLRPRLLYQSLVRRPGSLCRGLIRLDAPIALTVLAAGR